MQAVKLPLSKLSICTTSENTASGTANSTETTQIPTAFVQVHSSAPEVWTSMGFTMALYLRRQYVSNYSKKGRILAPKLEICKTAKILSRKLSWEQLLDGTGSSAVTTLDIFSLVGFLGTGEQQLSVGM